MGNKENQNNNQGHRKCYSLPKRKKERNLFSTGYLNSTNDYWNYKIKIYESVWRSRTVINFQPDMNSWKVKASFVELFHGIFQALNISTDNFRCFFSILKEVQCRLHTMNSFSLYSGLDYRWANVKLTPPSNISVKQSNHELTYIINFI